MVHEAQLKTAAPARARQLLRLVESPGREEASADREPLHTADMKPLMHAPFAMPPTG